MNAGIYLFDDRLANGGNRFSGELLNIKPSNEQPFGCDNWSDVHGYLHRNLQLEQYSYDYNDLVLIREAWLDCNSLGACNQGRLE
ncbi:hypothetical protein [Thiomicrorhabdus sp. Milos-T2]|uniref:hypothetical protein n=1 Tax=Thiomicrorhabdus sp. Milos-T2 TaxID=90814 RepID=UPI00049470E8|nr:hypothetical protein [Thiomicrorhabdus sp. Milos-T2]